VGDIVITSKEVIHGTVFQADTLYTRLTLPSGGIVVLMTRDIYEIRLTDLAQVESFTAKLPGVRVVPDTGKVFSRPKVGAEQAPARDPVAGGCYMIGGGANYTSTSVGGASISTITLTPSVAYFVTRGIALGGDIMLASASTSGVSSTSTAIGPKVSFALGPSGSSSFFIGEVGLAFATFGSEVTGTRTSFAIGYLPVVVGHLGIPIKLTLFIDDMGAISTTNWLLSLSLYGMLAPTQLSGQVSK